MDRLVLDKSGEGRVVGVCRKDGYAQLSVAPGNEIAAASEYADTKAVRVKETLATVRLVDEVSWGGDRLTVIPGCGRAAVNLPVVQE